MFKFAVIKHTAKQLHGVDLTLIMQFHNRLPSNFKKISTKETECILTRLP